MHVQAKKSEDLEFVVISMLCTIFLLRSHMRSKTVWRERACRFDQSLFYLHGKCSFVVAMSELREETSGKFCCDLLFSVMY